MIRAIRGGVVIDVRVVPRAGRSAVAGSRAGALLVRLAAAPVDGEANAELVSVLSRALSVPARAIAIIAGERSRQKRVQVRDIDETTARQRLV